MDEVISLIRDRLPTSQGPDQSADFSFEPPSHESVLEIDGRRLGFRVPALLRRLYREIGNGGFGPGYGLIGMSDGATDDFGRTAPEIYESLSTRHPKNSAWPWPSRLLPICHWGCAIYSCIDCATLDFPMRIFDPNVRADPSSWDDALFAEARSFEAWIEAWARGEDLWEASHGDEGFVARELRRRASNQT